MSRVRFRDFLAIDLRLALLQSTWSEGSMQSVGMAFSLVPGLQRIYSGDDLCAAMARYNEPVNTHPFLASVIAGATLKFEEEAQPSRAIDAFRRSAMGPLAALGDPFFDGALWPLIFIVSILLALLVNPIVGVVVLLGTTTSIQFIGRATGLYLGYQNPEGALTRVARVLNSRRTKVFRLATALAAGAVPALLVRASSLSPSIYIAISFIAAAMVLAVLFKQKRRSVAYFAPMILFATCILEVIL